MHVLLPNRYTQLTQSVAVYPLLDAMTREEHEMREAKAGLAAQAIRDDYQKAGKTPEMPDGWQMHLDPRCVRVWIR